MILEDEISTQKMCNMIDMYYINQYKSYKADGHLYRLWGQVRGLVKGLLVLYRLSPARIHGVKAGKMICLLY